MVRHRSETGVSVGQGAPAIQTPCSLLLSLGPWALTLWLTPQQISFQMFSLWQWDIFMPFYLTSPWELLFAFTRYCQETKAIKTHFNFSTTLALLLSNNGGIRTLQSRELNPRVRRQGFLSGQWSRLSLWLKARPLDSLGFIFLSYQSSTRHAPKHTMVRMSFVVGKTLS